MPPSAVSLWCFKVKHRVENQATKCLTTKTVKGASLALQSVNYIHSGNSLPACVLGVRYGISDYVLQENLENTSGLLVDQTGDTLYTTTASQTADGGFRDALDVIAKHLAMTFGTSFAQSFSAFSSSRHCACSSRVEVDRLRSLMFGCGLVWFAFGFVFDQELWSSPKSVEIFGFPETTTWRVQVL